MSTFHGEHRDDYPSAIWDGSNFAAVQMLLAGVRQGGAPACRIPGGDMSLMEVQLVGGWAGVQPGERVILAADEDDEPLIRVVAS